MSSLASSAADSNKRRKKKKIFCWLTKHLKDNHDMWVKVLKEEREREVCSFLLWTSEVGAIFILLKVRGILI